MLGKKLFLHHVDNLLRVRCPIGFSQTLNLINPVQNYRCMESLTTPHPPGNTSMLRLWYIDLHKSKADPTTILLLEVSNENHPVR